MCIGGSNRNGPYHRGISLNILSYCLIFLDIFMLNIFTISYSDYLYYFSILLSFLFLKSRKYFDQSKTKRQQFQEIVEIFNIKIRNSENIQYKNIKKY